MLQRDWMYVIQLCNSFLSGRLDKINSKSISMESTEDIKSLVELMRDHNFIQYYAIANLWKMCSQIGLCHILQIKRIRR